MIFTVVLALLSPANTLRPAAPQTVRRFARSTPIADPSGDAIPSLGRRELFALALGSAACAHPLAATAVSGGGKDYATANLRGRDFSQGNYKAKDFSGCDAQDVSFAGSKLGGARFYKADIARADFTGADLTSASLEDTSLDGAKLTNAVMANSYLSPSIESVQDIAGADFSEAVMRPDVQQRLCKRPDAKGTNPTTGIETRESLMCAD